MATKRQIAASVGNVAAAGMALSAKQLVANVMLAALFGSSLASMTPEGAKAAKDEIGHQVDIVLGSLTDAAFKQMAEAAARELMQLIDAAEADIRKRTAAAG
jgi:hypothetical protein